MNLSRRSLIAQGAALASLAAGAAHAAQPAAAQKWDEEVDVLIVGSGFAGLMAAYEAARAGASVLVIEKMATVGGNSIINGGIMGVPGTEFQKKAGIEDSPELMAKDMLKAGLNLNHRDKVKALCEGAYPAYRRLVDELGVEFKDVRHEGGHSVPRSLLTANGSGSEIVNKQLAPLVSAIHFPSSSPIIMR